ncbi:MAG: hypothetical protein ACRDOB_06795 [Streptosporangiaceae bacterium]
MFTNPATTAVQHRPANAAKTPKRTVAALATASIAAAVLMASPSGLAHFGGQHHSASHYSTQYVSASHYNVLGHFG